MDPRHLMDLRQREEHYWWHVNKRRIVLPLLEKYAGPGRGNLLEIGSGGGFLSSLLIERGWRVISSDVSLEAARFARERGVSSALLFDASHRWPFEDGVFRAICMLDVLEHVENDRLALSELQRVLAPGAVAILTVPAHPFLYSQWDRMLGHHRRYRRTELGQLARQCGLQVICLSYWNAVSLLPAVLLRTLKRQQAGDAHTEFPVIPEWVNRLLRVYGCVESRLVRATGVPAGLSLVTVLKKDPSADRSEKEARASARAELPN